MKAPVTRDRSERREIAPESRTSNSAGRQFGSTGESESKRPGPGYLFRTGLSDLVEEFSQIQIGFLQEVQASKFDPDRFLEQPGRSKPAFLDRPVEIVGKINLYSRHTPHYTHIAYTPLYAYISIRIRLGRRSYSLLPESGDRNSCSQGKGVEVS